MGAEQTVELEATTPTVSLIEHSSDNALLIRGRSLDAPFSPPPLTHIRWPSQEEQKFVSFLQFPFYILNLKLATFLLQRHS